jgi:hypothetical protein
MHQETRVETQVRVETKLLNALRSRYPELKGLSNSDLVDWAIRVLIAQRRPKTYTLESEIEKEAE